MKEKTTVSQLISETIGVSNLLSRKQVYVTFSDEGEACTDGDTIVIPELSLDKQLKIWELILSNSPNLANNFVRYVIYWQYTTLKKKTSIVHLIC